MERREARTDVPQYPELPRAVTGQSGGTSHQRGTEVTSVDQLGDNEGAAVDHRAHAEHAHDAGMARFQQAIRLEECIPAHVPTPRTVCSEFLDGDVRAVPTRAVDGPKCAFAEQIRFAVENKIAPSHRRTRGKWGQRRWWRSRVLSGPGRPELDSLQAL